MSFNVTPLCFFFFFSITSTNIHFKVDIIRHCLGKSRSNIIINDESEDNSIELRTSFSSHIPTHLFEPNKMTAFAKNKRIQKVYKIDEKYVGNKTYPAQSVIIITSSQLDLALVLEDMKNSIWWNHQAKSLIINKDLQNSCDIANAVLKTAWSFNISSVIYLCKTMKDRSLLYTFNPYSHLAPTFWKVEDEPEFVNESWSLLKHPIDKFSERSLNNRKYHSYHLKLLP